MVQIAVSIILAISSAAATSQTVSSANGCPMFNPAGELHIFGGPFGDLNLGSDPQVWTSATVPAQKVNITALADRPPFTSKNIICIPSFYLNSSLFINADPNDSSTIHEYLYAEQRWRKISTTGLLPNPDTVKAVMDYDTLVIYAFTDGKMVRLGDASSNNLNFDTNHDVPYSLAWVDADFNHVPFNGANYTAPTMAHGWINMYFFGVPGTNAGEVWGYRIHYNEWGPSPQSVGATFPSMHGQTATFLYKNASENTHDGAPSHIAYIPDDYSGLWVIDSYINVTQKCATPPQTGTSSLTRYAANYNILAQFTPDTGVLRFLDLTWLFQDLPLDPNANWIDATVLKSAPQIVPVTTGGVSTPTGKSSAAPALTVALVSMLILAFHI